VIRRAGPARAPPLAATQQTKKAEGWVELKTLTRARGRHPGRTCRRNNARPEGGASKEGSWFAHTGLGISFGNLNPGALTAGRRWGAPSALGNQRGMNLCGPVMGANMSCDSGRNLPQCANSTTTRDIALGNPTPIWPIFSCLFLGLPNLCISVSICGCPSSSFSLFPAFVVKIPVPNRVRAFRDRFPHRGSRFCSQRLCRAGEFSAVQSAKYHF
jgi:hypothetical protein